MNDNIIAINIPNAISIVIMGAIGAIIVIAVKKMLAGGGFPAIGGKGANATMYGAA